MRKEQKKWELCGFVTTNVIITKKSKIIAISCFSNIPQLWFITIFDYFIGMFLVKLFRCETDVNQKDS